MASRAERFAALFDGLQRAWGQYIVPRNVAPNERGKLEGEAWTKRGTLSLAQWEDHLDGNVGLGIVPIRDDRTVRFVAIDVDVYQGIDLQDYVQRVKAIGAPLVVCRSKSGGPHFYAFFSEPVPARLAVDRANTWAKLLGHAGCEVFPKQLEDVDAGNWINVPYFAGDRTVRYGHGSEGNALTPEEFLDYAEQGRVDRAYLESWEPLPVEVARPHLHEEGDFFGAPPCICTLHEQEFPPGTRNNGMLGVTVYLKQRFPDTWRGKVMEYNDRYMNPPKPGNEMNAMIKSSGKHDYGYPCSKAPFVSLCDRTECLKRQFGIGYKSDAYVDLELGAITKILTEPPTWRWQVNGELVDLTTEQMMNQKMFILRLIEETDIVGTPMSQVLWENTVRDKLKPENLVKRAVPEESTLRGQIDACLTEFCTGRAQAQSLDGILLRKPFTFGGRTYFLLQAFLEHLHANRVAYTLSRLQVILTDMGVEDHAEIIKGKPVEYCSVAERKGQSEPFDVPRREREEPF